MTAAWAEFEAYEQQIADQNFEKGSKKALLETTSMLCEAFQVPPYQARAGSSSRRWTPPPSHTSIITWSPPGRGPTTDRALDPFRSRAWPPDCNG